MSPRQSIPDPQILEKVQAPTPEVAEAQHKAIERDMHDNEAFAQAARDLERVREVAVAVPVPEPALPEGQRATLKGPGVEAERLTGPSLEKLLQKESSAPSNKSRNRAPGIDDTIVDRRPPRTTQSLSRQRQLLIRYGSIAVGLGILLAMFVILKLLKTDDAKANDTSAQAPPSKPPTATAPSTAALPTAPATTASAAPTPSTPTSAPSSARPVQSQAPSTQPATSRPSKTSAPVQSSAPSLTTTPPPPPPPPPTSSTGIVPIFP